MTQTARKPTRFWKGAVAKHDGGCRLLAMVPFSCLAVLKNSSQQKNDSLLSVHRHTSVCLHEADFCVHIPTVEK